EYEPEEYEEDNWSEPEPPRYEQSAYVEPEPPPYRYEDPQPDVWDDDVKPEPYNPPRVNFPEKTKAPEYEDGY
ncbi:MAG: photosystem reaction center subunit H, partial [Spirulinaceae cyanobacterium]